MADWVLGHHPRSQALGDLIMGTDSSSSIVSKRSVERLYYPREPHFFRYFVKKFQKRSPLVNRAHWLRLRAVDVIVRQFLTRPLQRKKVIISLGGGSHVLPWQCHARYGNACENALFVDVDYPDLMRKKRAIVLETPQLRQILGQGAVVSESDTESLLLRSDNYCQLACDFLQLDLLRDALESFLDLSQYELLFVTEVSGAYLHSSSADSLLRWASSLGQAQFCLLEQILPHDVSEHPSVPARFPRLGKLEASSNSASSPYSALESRRSCFRDRGWHQVDVWDLWDVWSSDHFLSPLERIALDDIEPFDEWEELMLFAHRNVVVHAVACPSTADTAEPTGQLRDDGGPSIEVKVTYQSETKAPKRRFGNAMIISNPMGQQFAIHMMGMGLNGHAETYDIYALQQYGTPARLPLSGPLPRICHTVTDIGDFGVLLVGGRGAAGSALSDCWIFRKGADCCWQATWRLPSPLYRHSAIRLKGSSLVLILGGKTGASQVSHDCYVYHPVKGWLRCDVGGARPEPAFGTILCNSSDPCTEPGVFRGLLAGGIGKDGLIVTRKYLWHLDTTRSQPVISFSELAKRETDRYKEDQLSVVGAQALELGSRTVICGGMGEDLSIKGRTVTLVTVLDNGYSTIRLLPSEKGHQEMPLMIGCSIVNARGSLVVLGGGAMSVSAGAFWETGVYQIEISDDGLGQHPLGAPRKIYGPVEYLESPRIVSNHHDGQMRPSPASKATITSVPRVRLESENGFLELLRNRTPVIIEGLDLGGCIEKWQPGYMVERVGQEKEVTVHECQRDTEKMDFNSKNFRYVTDAFGPVIKRMEAGGRLYLRSLSQAKPSESPANIEEDFPSLAADFSLPTELNHVREHIFSSVLRISGRVNMWLHYDVMANVYTQIRGSKRMMLFPPGDVTQLSFSPGASSSSLDVFSALDTPSLAATHPYEAMVSPGDMLLLPPMWLHTATPTTDMSVAVNVFFRDLLSGYSTGRDVYGNRDLAAYEKGRQDAARIGKSFEGLPGDIRRFYVARIADELRQGAECV